MKAPKFAAAAASSRSASSSTTSGALPPSSSSTGLRYFAAFSAMILPTCVEPVKLIRWTRGSAISASTVAAAPSRDVVSTLIAPAGSPASSSTSPMMRCVCGHSSDALRTTVLPQASGIATARTPRIIGAFHGAMPSTTPTGWRTAIAMLPGMSEGITSPVICVRRCGRLAHHARGEEGVEHAPAEGAAGFGRDRLGDVRARAPRAGRRPSTGSRGASTAASSTIPRRRRRRPPTAATASSGPASGTRATSSPVNGLRLLVVAAVGGSGVAATDPHRDILHV